MDETNRIPSGETPQEVVLWYVPQPQGVTQYYVQPTPLPGAERTRQSEQALRRGTQQRRHRKGLRIFLLCLGLLVILLAALAAVRYFFPDERGDYWSYGDDGWYGDWYEEEPAETTIARYPSGGEARLPILEQHGPELTAEEIYARVNPSTVVVLTRLEYGSAVGTGVIMTPDGYLLTNAHVISGGQSVTVSLSTGETYDAQLVGFDEAQDIAVLKVDAQDLPAAEFGDSDSLTVGEKVYAIGNPLGVELRGTFTDGILSAINRDVEMDGVTMTLLQTNAALNSGNSGGPLINRYGQVIGINTMKMDTPHYSADTATVEGLGFAIPISSAAWMVNDLIAYGALRGEAVMGISVLRAQRALPDGTPALEVYEVTPAGPGEAAGLLPGDLIVTADGESLSTSSDLVRVRRRHSAGESLHLLVWRSGEFFETDVFLAIAQP